METKRTYRFKPSFGTAYGTGWRVMGDNFLRFLLVVIILGLLTTPMSIGKFDLNDLGHFDHMVMDPEKLITLGAIGLVAGILGFMVLLYNLLVLPVFQYGGRMMFLTGARGTDPDFDHLISGFRTNYLNIILANLLVVALVGIGLVCLIIPGIVIGCRLGFTSFLVMDKGLDPIKAVEESWRMTRGHGWTIFFMGFVSIFIFILGFACLFFGVFIAIMWVKSAFAALYQSVLIEKGLVETEAEPAVA
ncbi:MAG TPA: hypothetical protein PLP69_01945 [Bacteroidales bacterium]|nr:hypothetical protein [Bacteroidales bacterium]